MNSIKEAPSPSQKWDFRFLHNACRYEGRENLLCILIWSSKTSKSRYKNIRIDIILPHIYDFQLCLISSWRRLKSPPTTKTWWWMESIWLRMKPALASWKSSLDLSYFWGWVSLLNFRLTKNTLPPKDSKMFLQADEPTHIGPAYHAEEATTRHEEQGFKGTGLLSN